MFPFTWFILMLIVQTCSSPWVKLLSQQSRNTYVTIKTLFSVLKRDFHGEGTLCRSNFHVTAFSVLSVYSRFYYILSKNFCKEHVLRQRIIFKKSRGTRKDIMWYFHVFVVMVHPCYLVHYDKTVALHLHSTNKKVIFFIPFFSSLIFFQIRTRIG